MTDLGDRINRLKNFMKEVTGGKVGKNGGVAKMRMQVNPNNVNNRIFQEDKIMITPSYTRLEKKIA